MFVVENLRNEEALELLILAFMVASQPDVALQAVGPRKRTENITNLICDYCRKYLSHKIDLRNHTKNIIMKII